MLVSCYMFKCSLRQLIIFTLTQRSQIFEGSQRDMTVWQSDDTLPLCDKFLNTSLQKNVDTDIKMRNIAGLCQNFKQNNLVIKSQLKKKTTFSLQKMNLHD